MGNSILSGLSTAFKGMSLTWKHFFSSHKQRTILPASNDTTKRLYAAKFDIDMAKCMYCGLCTIVCPTECITMTNQYDRSVVKLEELTYQFSDMTPEMAAQKRREFEQQQAERQAAKLAAMQKKEEGQ